MSLHSRRKYLAFSLVLALFTTSTFSGCGSLRYWRNNDRKVGPNYSKPAAPLASAYSDDGSPYIDTNFEHCSQWWEAFNDDDLNLIVELLQQQNLSLKAACFRIKESRHLRQIAAANLLPQSQQGFGGFAHTQNSSNTEGFMPGFSPLTINDWQLGFDVSWELDLWGRIRRSVTAADANVCFNVFDRNAILISLIGDAASLYIQIRSLDERIELAQRNVEIQEGSLDIAEKRFKEGRTSKLDMTQAESNLATTRSLIPQLELSRRQAINALSILLGCPPGELPFDVEQPGRIPSIPNEIIVGIPADLLCRRPDIRAAERQMAAQFEQIGITEADMYPTLAISGNLGYEAARLSDLFESASYFGTIAPGFRWNILNYGRIQQAVCAEEARFKQILFDYRNLVLNAQREVEDGIIEFIKRSEQFEFDKQTAEANAESVELSIAEFKAGKSDFSRVFVVQANLVSAQDQVVATKANIALALINTYRALGGGWEQCCQQSDSCNCRLSAGFPDYEPLQETDRGSSTIVESDLPALESEEEAPQELETSESTNSLIQPILDPRGSSN